MPNASLPITNVLGAIGKGVGSLTVKRATLELTLVAVATCDGVANVG